MLRPARGFDRPAPSERPRHSLRRLSARWFGGRRWVGAAALLAGLAVPAGLGAQAYTSFYGLRAYTTYTDPYSGASTQTVRPFWDVLGVFQRPVVASGSVVSAGYASPSSYSASYAPASYGTSYYGGSSYAPAVSYYGDSVYDSSATYYGGTVTDGALGGSFYNSSYAGGALPYRGTTTYSVYGSSRGSVTLGDACCQPAPACSPCADPCGGNACQGGNCTSYSVPGDDDVIESDPVFADPPEDLDPVPSRRPSRPSTRDRDRDPLDDLEPPSFEDSFDDAAPSDRPRPAPRTRPEDSVRDEFSDEFPDDERPTGDPFENPLDDGGDFGADPMTGTNSDGDFGDAPGSGVRPAENTAPFRRDRGGLAEPPGARTRPVPSTDESFSPLDDPTTGNFQDSRPNGGATPGNYGANPGGVQRPSGTGDAFGGDPDNVGRPGDGAFADPPGESPAFSDEFFEEDVFGNDPNARSSFRLEPNDVDLTGPPTSEDEDAAGETADGTDAPEDAASNGDAAEDADAADPDSARLSAPEPESGPTLDPAEPAEPSAPASGDAAAAQPRLITAQLLHEDLRRTRLTLRVGHTRIARFRHRPVDSATTPDVQIAAQ
ncbi:hypothetical protein [Alienimonas californiensis]|uniref:hypothetical protein n=1 Tax=Alienimonas californiensis TaxID=2527989 RepID=UPI00119E9173|nr:hypothetical protein [Alienimonas californiensis]